MIERFYLKEHLSFEEVELEFDKNFIIFTGASGAGKSILMEALLSLFGLKESEAKRIEASINIPLDLEEFGLEEDRPNIFTLNRQKSARYFINHQQVSKKNIKRISQRFLNYLTLREFSEFENENLLALVDAIAQKEDTSHKKRLQNYQELFQKHQQIAQSLQKIEEEERRVEELREFTAFEIEKIEKINPSINEYEELLVQKKELSKKEKLENALNEASQIFQFSSKVNEALQLLEKESNFFDEAMNELQILFEEASLRLQDLEDLDIETLLNRIEELSALKRKYGSIEEALLYLEKKKEDLKRYENLSFEKETLQKEYHKSLKSLQQAADTLTQKRAVALQILQKRVEHHLNLLYLQEAAFRMERASLQEMGQDQIFVTLKKTPLQKISSGELNRLRLALLAAASEFVQSGGGVLILDEIDANLSGKESMSIATVLQTLSKKYQIFAISHQPQLSSCAQMHFLVYKEGNKSGVKLLNDQERVKELSRMISGEEITQEAQRFAKSLLKKRIA